MGLGAFSVGEVGLLRFRAGVEGLILDRLAHSQQVIVVGAIVAQPGDASGLAACSTGSKPKDIARLKR